MEAIEICNRLYTQCYVINDDDVYETIGDVLVYWHGIDIKENERIYLNEAINSINGKVVGGREITDTLYVEVSNSSIEGGIK